MADSDANDGNNSSDDSSSSEEDSDQEDSPGAVRARARSWAAARHDMDHEHKASQPVPTKHSNKTTARKSRLGRPQPPQLNHQAEPSYTDWEEPWTEDWTEDWPADHSWTTEEAPPSKASKYAKSPPVATSEGNMARKRREKAAKLIDDQQRALHAAPAAPVAKAAKHPVSRKLTTGFSDQYVGHQKPEETDCLAHAVNSFLNHTEFDVRLRHKMDSTDTIADFLNRIEDIVGMETYVALVVVPGRKGGAKKRAISQANEQWAKEHADHFNQPFQDKAAEHSINDQQELVPRLNSMNQGRYLLEICEDDNTTSNHLISIYKDEDGQWYRKDSLRHGLKGTSAGKPIAPIETLYKDHPKAIFMVLAMLPLYSGSGPRGLDNLWLTPEAAASAPSSGGETQRFRPAHTHPMWKKWTLKAETDRKAGRPAMGPYRYAQKKGPTPTPTGSAQTTAQATADSDKAPAPATKAKRGKGNAVPETDIIKLPPKEPQTPPTSTRGRKPIRTTEPGTKEPGPPWRYTGMIHEGLPLYCSDAICQIQHSSSTVGRRMLVEVRYAIQDNTGELLGVFDEDLTPAQLAATGLPGRPQPSPAITTVSPRSKQTTLTFPKAPPARPRE